MNSMQIVNFVEDYPMLMKWLDRMNALQDYLSSLLLRQNWIIWSLNELSETKGALMTEGDNMKMLPVKCC